MHNLFKFARIAAPVLLLCSCAAMQGSKQVTTAPVTTSAAQAAPAKPPAPNKVFQATNDAYPAVDDIFDEKQEIKAAQNIEKDGILVSYSLLTVPSKAGDLQRLALIFRNMQSNGISIQPKVFLEDATGKRVKHYSKRGFIKASSYLATETNANGGKALVKIDQKSIKERIDWINAYWLKPSYDIPAQGIAIGEMVYYCDHCRQPLKLRVNLGKQEFIFTTQEPLPVASNH